MASSLSNLVEAIHKTKCKYWHDDKKFETCIIKYKNWNCLLEYSSFKDDLVEYKCTCCNRNYETKLRWKFKKAIFKYINKFITLFQKGFYPYEYMIDLNMIDWFTKLSLAEKENLYSHLNMEHITDADYAHAKKVWIRNK